MTFSKFLLKIKQLKNKGARVVHVCAENDINGNPQRLYYDTEKNKAYDEGYSGHHAVPKHLRDDAASAEFSFRLNVSADTYSEMLFLEEIGSILFD